MSGEDRTKRILIVDDMAAIRRILAIEIADLGYSVDTAVNGMEAQKLLYRNYDVLLVDIRMPVMDGRELFIYIRERCPDLANKIIFMSADYPDASMQRLLEETKCPFIMKPFEIGELKTLIYESTHMAM